ncbi:dTDP-4-dehydrorhamnose 3,5-epimerase [Rhodomicrobium udaipurense JA643]|uniref:dTDP-4-dehydrorhamnose 3,5-epimerase n=1 Tax=Rhodomicrobium udaipurense TaxID=1202716 RepID=A0A8I1GC79_9HYPH|nr:dTDP-4-dehydrorhamnose 3,5-epimerase [Rhodomicrobium udaipurense]KAI95223.1 dTDP-4-dehydrorhamnose 3,5-epimerase [Rhodomicrobium udaipurense JA643]MBJ7542284.1 dTDP-4-dehydrorhamnose 3,5-epimerase [Rhodomicrobium udaipurense]
MLFQPALLEGAFIVEPEPFRDERGFFARTFCTREFEARGLVCNFVQHSISSTVRKGTVRGMHFQTPPHAEVKVVTCTRGAIFDAIVDLRRTSPTFLEWQGFELTAENRKRFYIPEGFAHGFQSLTDDVEVSYLISAFYAPESASGIRHDDPLIGIEWPLSVNSISEKDRNWPPFNASAAPFPA